MNGINFYSMKIQQINRENPDVHISRVLKALTKNEQEIISIFNLLVTDKEIMNLIDGYYFPKKEEQLANRHFEYDPLVDMSIYYLFDWGVMLLEFYREKMNSFFHMKMQYENALFGENYKEAYNSLRKIVDEFGISEWVYSQEFVLSSLCGDNKNNAKDSFLNNSCAYSNILKIILVYYDKMANSNVNYEDYSNSVSKMLEKENLKSIRGRYLRYKLNINFNKSKSIHDFKSALILDEQISLVDYYETFIDVLQNLYYQPRMTSLIRSIVYKLHDFLDDYRIRNLYIALGGTIKKVQVDQYINTVIEKYTMGNYTGLINEYQNCSAFGIVDFDLYNIFLKANINIGKLKTPHSKLWNELFSIYNLKYKLGEAVNAIGGYYKLLYNTSWKYKLYGILSRKLNFIKNDEILFLCVINDRYLTPLFFQSILSNKGQIDYLNVFEDIAYNTSCLHKYVLLGVMDVNVLDKVDPIRVKYYTIKRKMNVGDYVGSITLCESFLQDIFENTNKMYYQERIRRTLFSSYISKRLWVNAMHLYVQSYLLVEELVVRMSLDVVVEGILNDSEYDESICFDICKPIILRLHYKGDDREVISAYMDYLEGQGCRTIIEYIESRSKLDEYEIFFLYNVCTESLLVRDYVSTSLIKGNAVDLRIYVLRILLERDIRNSKRYFEELNTLFKEIQLQDRREAFNHNRIFIDKIKLMDYLNNTINKEFSEYLKVQEIRKMYDNKNDIEEQKENYGFENIYQFFYDIVKKIEQAYLFDSPYSLEDFLSTRIRHVFCKDSLKKVFEEQTLFAKKLKDSSDEYVINEYWHDKLEKNDYSRVLPFLSEFSRKIDLKIQETRDIWIRIRKNKNGYEMFDYCDFAKEFLTYTELDFNKVLDSETEFYSSVISELDRWTNMILERVRERINDELKPYYGNALLELEAGIRNVYITENCKRELLRRIEISKAKYTEDISKFEDIFYMKSEQYPRFTIKDVVEFCCEIEKDINPKFSLAKFEIDNDCGNIYNGSIFPYMVDIISILIHNAVEHSLFQDIKLLQIKIAVHTIDRLKKENRDLDERLKDFSILLNVKNNLADNVNEQELGERVMNIIGSMEANTFREKSKLVKGSGLYKIARTLYYNLDGLGAFYYKKEKGWFDLSIAMNLNKYLEEK